MQYVKREVFIAVFAASVIVMHLNWRTPAQSQERAFVPPPRTITDITAILDQENPNPETAAKMRAVAEAQPTGRGAELAQFLYDRCLAKAGRGDTAGALADCG